jgi:hypothetical protein
LANGPKDKVEYQSIWPIFGWEKRIISRWLARGSFGESTDEAGGRIIG